ncbi:MAG: MKRN2 opposite strand protein [Chitinispirillaceae bacterium]|nr:MKRN2 opposite strand protein [Chitinispirillaceae bacterium]
MREKIKESGFAVVYGLIVLMIATLAGSSMLFMAQKERIAISDVSKMRSATLAAIAALKAVEGQLLNNPTTALDILKEYLTNPNQNTWMLGTLANCHSEQRIKMWNSSDAPEFSARIVAYDSASSFLVIEGTGYGSNGGKKKVLGTYQITGVEMVTVPGPVNALYVGAGFGNLDIPLVINGNVFAGGSSMWNGNCQSVGVTINGDLKTGTGNFETNQKLTVNGKAFFRGNAMFQNQSATITGKTGFKGNLSLNSVNINLTNDVFINGDDLGNGFINVSGGAYKAKYYTAGGFDPNEIKVTAPATKEAVSTSMASTMGNELGMPDIDDPAPTIRSDLETYITNSGGTIYTPSTAGLNFDQAGWNLVSAYNNSNIKKWNGFLVIKVSSTININQQGPSNFNGKVIWIIETSISSNKWYTSSSTSNTLIYIKGNGRFDNFGEDLPSGTTMRGVIFNSSSSATQTTYKIKAGTTIEGSLIHTATTKPQFNVPNCSSPVTINYDEDVIQEFVNIGIMTLPTSGIAPYLAVVDVKIRPTMLSMQL